MNLKIKVPVNRKHLALFVYNIPTWLIGATIIVVLIIGVMRSKFFS